jgi:hypothetical protein
MVMEWTAKTFAMGLSTAKDFLNTKFEVLVTWDDI